jgi:hypothetical protein
MVKNHACLRLLKRTLDHHTTQGKSPICNLHEYCPSSLVSELAVPCVLYPCSTPSPGLPLVPCPGWGMRGRPWSHAHRLQQPRLRACCRPSFCALPPGWGMRRRPWSHVHRLHACMKTTAFLLCPTGQDTRGRTRVHVLYKNLIWYAPSPVPYLQCRAESIILNR